MGFAPPPHGGFAFVAAPERPRICENVLSQGRQDHMPHRHFFDLNGSYDERLHLKANLLERRNPHVTSISPTPMLEEERPQGGVEHFPRKWGLYLPPVDLRIFSSKGNRRPLGWSLVRLVGAQSRDID